MLECKFMPCRNSTVLLEGVKRLKHEIPVIPTNGTKLLMAFYNGNARINEGRDISPEEYRNGENNIVGMGPMKGYTTSFQITNGQIEQYRTKWEALGITNLKIKFYDKGYSKVRTGLQTMKNTAVILFAVGAVTTLLVIILFCNLFITKQRKRTAIERSLGMSKRLCTVSLLAGLLFIVVAAYAFGSAAGYVLTDYTVKHVNITHSQEAFDNSYSDWENSSDADSISNVGISKEGTVQGALVAATVIPVAFLLAFINIFGNLRSEPLKLLGEKDR